MNELRKANHLIGNGDQALYKLMVLRVPVHDSRAPTQGKVTCFLLLPPLPPFSASLSNFTDNRWARYGIIQPTQATDDSKICTKVRVQ